MLIFYAGTSSNALVGDSRQIGTDTKQRQVPRLLIIDGQQRLTSLYAVLKNMTVLRDDYSSQKISIAFRPKDGSFEVADAAIRRDPEYIHNISELWAGQTTYLDKESMIVWIRNRMSKVDTLYS